MSTDLADDLLPTAKSIARYVYNREDKEHQRKIYHAREKKGWPIWKDGAHLVSRKSLLDEYFNPPTKVEAAE